MSQSPAGAQLDFDLYEMSPTGDILRSSVAIPRRVSAQFRPRYQRLVMTHYDKVAIPRRVSARFRQPISSTRNSESITDVAIPRRVSARFRQDALSLPVPVGGYMSQSPAGSQLDFDADQNRSREDSSMSQSPAGSQLDFDTSSAPELINADLLVAIPRRVSARFRRAISAPTRRRLRS